MPKITFLPPGKTEGMTVEASPGETILEVAVNHDVPIQHACGGFCACTTCHLQVKEGLETLSEMEDEEQDRLDSVADLTMQSRLACQTKLGKSDVVVQIVNWEG